jgi:hypothetical protein
MLQHFKYFEQLALGKVEVCCPPPKTTPDPPPLQDPDCCYNSWLHKQYFVNKDLAEVNNELDHLGKDLNVVNDRLGRLTAWNTELVTANDLAFKICHQLELIDSQLIEIEINTEATKKSIAILICMVREFYFTVDLLHVRYDRLINCIKCLNNPALTLTAGIGKCLSDFGVALTAVVATRDGLIQQVMAVYSAAVGLHQQLCDGNYGYKRLITIWLETLSCGDRCTEGFWGFNPARQGSKEANMPDAYWPKPVLRLPICNEAYVHKINELYRLEKEIAKELTERQTEKTKRKNHLTTVQTGLNKAIQEVQPTARCS